MTMIRNPQILFFFALVFTSQLMNVSLATNSAITAALRDQVACNCSDNPYQPILSPPPPLPSPPPPPSDCPPPPSPPSPALVNFDSPPPPVPSSVPTILYYSPPPPVPTSDGGSGWYYPPPPPPYPVLPYFPNYYYTPPPPSDFINSSVPLPKHHSVLTLILIFLITTSFF